MTADPFDTPTPKTKRDGHDRPYVIPPGRKNPVGYTRCTTYIGCIEDTNNLEKWQQRMVALGLADRPDLLLSVAAHRDDKNELNSICAQAREAAKASAKATKGTALHRIAERIDRGEDPGIIPAAHVADVEAYRRITKGIKWEAIEELVVNDALRIAGTPDRRGKVPASVAWMNPDQKKDPKLGKGGRYIIDLKTGRVDFGAVKIAMQLAVYARSVTYKQDGNLREEYEVSQRWALALHQPQGTGVAQFHWVNIEDGWKWVQVAKSVRAARNGKPMTPIGAAIVVAPDAVTVAARPAAPVAAPAFDSVPDLIDQVLVLPEMPGVPALAVAPPDLRSYSMDQVAEFIATAPTDDALRRVFVTFKEHPAWDADMLALVHARKAVLA